MPTGNPCIDSLIAKGKLTEDEAKSLLDDILRMAEGRSMRSGNNVERALREVEQELVAGEQVLEKVRERNLLLNIRAKQRLTSFAQRFNTLGEGVRAFLEGGKRDVPGARFSVDYQSRALHGMYFGKLVSMMEDQGVLGDFRSGKITREIYQEMGETGKQDGRPGVSGNLAAQKIAKILDEVTGEMTARQNQAGAFITRLPGYITRQTHDRSAIRAAGNEDAKVLSKERSFAAWRDFVLPLLDQERTFRGAPPSEVLRKIHENLFTGIYGPALEADIAYQSMFPSIANKMSQQRLLHFKDADSAYLYNQAFGTRNIQDATFADLMHRSRNIALMENLGPNPSAVFNTAMRELQEVARSRDDAAKQADSLHDWKIQAAFNEVSGANDNPANVTLHRTMSNIKAVAQMAKMGSVVLSSFPDKAFMQAEFAYQGMSYLESLGKQIAGMINNSKEKRAMTRMMGVAMDGLLGNTMSRYTMHDQVSGFINRVQKKFFDLNFLNLWTDVNKATAAEMMSAHLAEHANLPFEKLPPDLQRVLGLYELSGKAWDAIRSTKYTDSRGYDFITPDKLSDIPDEVIRDLIRESRVLPAGSNIAPDLRALPEMTETDVGRKRAELETRLRTYFADRVDYAVPTPGSQQRKWMTLNTRAGTPLGEGIRLMAMFKSFPTTVMTKIMAREMYGRGSDTMAQWLMHDGKGKFYMAQMIAMVSVAGYLSGVVRDLMNGKTPKRLTTDEGGINYSTLNDAVVRGGGMGIMSDILFNEYDRGTRNFLSYAAGPIVGQLDPIASITTRGMRGENVRGEAGKLMMDNMPFINLFYIRPILNYLILWNLQEMMSPGILRRIEDKTSERYGQDYLFRPSDYVR